VRSVQASKFELVINAQGRLDTRAHRAALAATVADEVIE
jgi:hypothetical protein